MGEELGLNALRRLRPVSYTYIDGNVKALGFIAEEVNQVDSRPVAFDNLGRVNALDYNQIIPILTKSLQEIDTKVSTLEEATRSAQVSASLQESRMSPVEEILNRLADAAFVFWKTITFQSDVIFIGRPTCNKDTAGFAVIEAGDTKVDVRFERAYGSEPVVVASPSQTVTYAIINTSPQGFTIELSTAVSADVRFSWSAWAVQDVKSVHSNSNTSSKVEPSPSMQVQKTEIDPEATSSSKPVTYTTSESSQEFKTTNAQEEKNYVPQLDSPVASNSAGVDE